MKPVSVLRLNMLRASYLLVVVGLGLTVWPEIIAGPAGLPLSRGLVVCMLGGFSLMALIGLRYPLQMLPVLLWEITWKALWLLTVALPLHLANHVTPGVAENTFACGLVVIFLIVVPWDYVVRHYILKAGDPWWSGRATVTGPALQPTI
jgi:hypothetical protein